ncbi:MAG TPA: shikimate dehydrogenase [Sphingomicrobium sp.]|nr:shikimate dehydrogenase [Sphingomicrobium sp.]
MTTAYAEVIGDPVTHSKSPLIHNHWLECLGINAEYRATTVRGGELAKFIAERRSDPDWRGCNITLPHKETALVHADLLSDETRAIGAVNCIVPRGNLLVGYNSDVEGVAAALDRLTLGGRKVVIIGGGGAARAALSYLARRDTGEIVVLVRDVERARPLKRMLPSGLLSVGSLSDPTTFMAGASLIINASPLGMRGCASMPVDLISAVSAQDADLFDMVYDPITSDFLAAGNSQRIDGLSMLLGQAREAFERFFGVPPPSVDVELRSALSG